MEREDYRRRQRRRAIIAWSTAALLLVFAAVGVISAADKESTPAPAARLFPAQMSSEQYEAIHKGQRESLVLQALHDVGLEEGEVEASGLLRLFPPRPDHSICSYWTLSDAPEHLVRLCFSKPQSLLLQKSVAAAEDEAAPTTLA